MRAIFVKATVITNVKGRIAYITNETGKQEHMYAISGNLNKEFWEMLAKESQETFRASGNNRMKKMTRKDGTVYYKKQRACEAREIVINMLDMPEHRAQEFADALESWFREKYGVECIVVNVKQAKRELKILKSEFRQAKKEFREYKREQPSSVLSKLDDLISDAATRSSSKERIKQRKNWEKER